MVICKFYTLCLCRHFNYVSCICIWNILLKTRKIDGIYALICLFLLFESFLTGVVMRFNLKSMLMVNTSILLPAAISTLNIETTNVKKGTLVVGLLSIGCIFLQTNMGYMGRINSNTLSFLAYMMISIGFIWCVYSKEKILPAIYLICCLAVVLQTGSRNAAITTVLCIVVLVIPKRIIKKKIVYRCIYGASLLYTVFALRMMRWGFSNLKINELLNTFVATFSKKAWGMEGRIDFFIGITERINSLGFFTKVLGEGVSQHLGHNLCYQCIFVWGIIGTILIYILLIRVFEMAYNEIKAGNCLVLGCFVILIGHIILNGADVYLFGGESCQPLPLIIIGIIMQQYRHLRVEDGRPLYVGNELA